MSSAAHYVNIFTGESTGTIREALDALDTIDPSGPEHAKKIIAIREGLLRKLYEAEHGNILMPKQGSLF